MTSPPSQEREREDIRAKMAAQKREYYDRQQAAQRNRQAAEQQVFGGGVPVEVSRAHTVTQCDN